MKSFSVALLVLLLGYNANAQIERKTIALNGTSNMNFIGSLPNNSNGYDLKVSGGYFILDNWQVGISLNYQSLTVYDNVDESKRIFNGFGNYTRYYINGELFVGIG
jgi:hypothetical protein